MPAAALRDLDDGEVRLRPPTAADVPTITRVCQDPDIQRWTRVPSPYTEQDARSFALMATGALAEGTGAHLLVTPSGGPEGEVLGCVGVGRDGTDRVGELGYWIAADARGRGVATRAGRLLARAAFEHLDVHALQLTAAVANEASNRVARAIGFRLVGVLRHGTGDRRPGADPADRIDVNVYDLLPHEVR